MIEEVAFLLGGLVAPCAAVAILGMHVVLSERMPGGGRRTVELGLATLTLVLWGVLWWLWGELFEVADLDRELTNPAWYTTQAPYDALILALAVLAVVELAIVARAAWRLRAG